MIGITSGSVSIMNEVEETSYQEEGFHDPKVSAITLDEDTKLIYTFKSEGFGEVSELLYGEDFSDIVPVEGRDYQPRIDGNYVTLEVELDEEEDIHDYSDELEEIRRKVDQIGGSADSIDSYRMKNPKI